MPLLAGSEVIKVILLSALVSSQQYVKAPPQYQVQDREREHSAGTPVDYTSYLSGAPAKAPAAEEKGFVEPIDFSGLFAGASSGIRALAPSAGTVKDFFTVANTDRDPFSLALGSATSQFPSEVEVLAEQNNGTGFTNPQVKFQSLFDISGSASEAGFRPQDFLQPKKTNEGQQSSEESDAYSPSFAGLTSDYKPSYSKPASATPNYYSGSQDHTPYRASPSEERNTQSSENYNDQASYKPKYTESYAANPSQYHKNKYASEIAPGKSSYPAPSISPVLYSSPETYKSLSSELRPEKTNVKEGTYGGYSSYAPPNVDFHPRNTDYNSEASAKPQGQSVYSSPTSVYGAKSSDSNASPKEKNTYTSSPSDLYKQFGIEIPQPSAVSKASTDSFGSTAVPFSPKVSSAPYSIYPSVSTTIGSYLPQATNYHNLPNEQGQIYEKRATTPKEATATNTQEKKCKKVEKHVSSDDIVKGRFRREAMSCFVCEDPKTTLNYEKCSYEPEPQGTNYFKGHSQSYKVNLARAPGYRFRRDLEKIVFDFEKEWNLETEKIYPRKVRQHSGYGYDSKDLYKYGPEYFGPYFEDKYTSPAEYTPSATAPDPKHCKKVEKDQMTCYECTDPKNGGTYEQCSYSAKPKEKNYFIAHQTSYNKDNKPKNKRHHRGFSSNGDGAGEVLSRTTRQEPGSGYGYKDEKSNTPASSEETYSPREFSAASENTDEKKAGIGYDPYVYKGPEYFSTKDKSSEETGRVESYFEPSRSYDEYFKRLFPELVEADKTSASTHDSQKYDKPVTKFGPPPSSSSSSSESKSEPLKTVPKGFFTNNENKKDLEKVLGEFSNKDWSSCKKIIRDKMTCYQCVDKKGLQHEECMYVAASEPKKQHLAYHEVKEFRLVPTDDSQSASASDTQSNASPSNDSISSPSNLSEETTSPTCALASSKALPSTLTTTITTKPKRKTFFKKVTTTPAPTDSKFDETQQRHFKKMKLRGGDSKSPRENGRLTRRTTQSVTSTKRTSLTPPSTSLLEDQPTRRLVRRKVTMSATDMVESASTVNNKKRARPKSQDPLPSWPELSERDRSPDGYYSAETRTRFDPVLKVTLPEYMLTRSEHEAIFDEVMASGHKH